MRSEDVTKVVIDERDIVNALECELFKRGLKPKNDIKINIGCRIEGMGLGEHEVYYISDTIVECVKVKEDG